MLDLNYAPITGNQVAEPDYSNPQSPDYISEHRTFKKHRPIHRQMTKLECRIQAAKDSKNK